MHGNAAKRKERDPPLPPKPPSGYLGTFCRGLSLKPQWFLLMCSEHYTCVCGCMSAEEAGAGERGRECESEIYTYISFTFYFILLLSLIHI